ncbi:MAG TPA: class I SAM-dependent methyltransferase [Trebonia sp.]|nr:class I SAM-dependent methyltransferase [Trebonia sp.]
MTAIIVTAIVVAGLIVNGLRLRARVPSALPAAPAGPGGSRPPGPDWTWLTARGTAPDAATRRAAAAHAAAERLEMLELVPSDLPVTAARDMLRRVDPVAYRDNRIAVGRGAGIAVLVAGPMAERADARPVDEPGDPADVVAAIRHLRPCAPSRGAAIVVAPGLRYGTSPGGGYPAGGGTAGDGRTAGDLDRRRARLQANQVVVSVHVALDAIPFALTALALAAGWPWGLLALAAYCLQPYLIFAGTALAPRGLHAAALGRPVHAPYVIGRTLAGRWQSAAGRRRDVELAAAGPYYQAALAAGPQRFLEERRPDCPWCASPALTVAVRSPDLGVGKPGTFTLERCGNCGHVFQNPRLTLEGLGFYYRDVYDGLGTDTTERVFTATRQSYLGRAGMVRPYTTPKAWLDVGAGHGHFAAIAAEAWPETVFDGLDMGAGILEAERRGWVDTAYHGEFPALADTLAGRYDVISMHHYLEHTRDPRAELDAAARALPPGGYLLIELPDPQWPLAGLFGRYWMPWFQPQHQHLMPLANLAEALEQRGLRPVAVERGPAHIASDFFLAAVLWLWHHASPYAVPWRPPASAAGQAWRAVLWMVGVPVMAAGLLLDLTAGRALARRRDVGNAYRILARKEDILSHDR